MPRCTPEPVSHRSRTDANAGAGPSAQIAASKAAAAQQLADGLDATVLHRHLDHWAQHCCPVLRHFRNGVHWSFTQVEYATDVVFRQQAKFQPL
jgi:hypothetical protein